MLTLLRSSRIQEARPKRPCLHGSLRKKLGGQGQMGLDREIDDSMTVTL